MSNSDGGPAFPLPITRDPDGGIFDPRGYGADGMNLRDYFAAHAMQGMLAEDASGYTVDSLAKASYEMADAMLAERSKS